MNATSSRSHTIVSIGLDQKRTTQIGEVTITSVVNIVDLAGRYVTIPKTHFHVLKIK
jgi:hypothetical protein